MYKEKTMPGNILGEPNKYADNGFVGSDTGGGAFVGYRNPRRRQQTKDSNRNNTPAVESPRDLPVSPGAIPEKPAPAEVVTTVADRNAITTSDLRVRIRVPSDYLTKFTSGGKGELSKLDGIIFPYTPTVSTEWKAEYGSSSPTHSNYSIYFYKNSSVSDIVVSGKFTVQNEQDALVYLSTLHLLRSLTKMRWGGKIGDPDSGAPPPVCRFDAYGAFQYKNVPVVITSFKNDLPAEVDFYAYNRNGDNKLLFGPAFCPVSSTIAVSLRPVYSRREMQEISTGKYLNESDWKSKGYL
jgi:hypothetical protein